MTLDIDPDDIVSLVQVPNGWVQRHSEGSAPILALGLTRIGNVVPITPDDIVQPGCRECTIEFEEQK